ncbi:MAG TPA: hypothetical protein VKT32_07025 [Chthonomonadaceae bacterium]|nr:hypothetical protein [Chthonomonadaceae bacterium]
MSYDELPPDSAPARPQGGSAAQSRPEVSAPEASPAAPARRRRGKAAGSAASSESVTPTPDPSLSESPGSRRRRKTAAAPTNTAALPPAIENAVPDPAPAAEAPPQRSRRPRHGASTPPAEAAAPIESAAPAPETPTPPTGRGRRRKGESSPGSQPAAETVLPPPEMPARETPIELPAEATPRAPRRRRGRKAAAQTEAPIEASPAPEGLPTIAPIEEPAPEAERPAGRRRRRRPARETASAEEAAAAPATELRPAWETVEPLASAPIEAETPALKEPSRRRRRGERARRPEPAAEARAPESEEIEERIDRSVGAHLLSRHGLPEIHIHGRPYAPIFFFGNMESASAAQRVLSEARRAARAGVHLHSTLIELPCPLTEATDALDTIDDRLREILEADPEGYLMPRLLFVPTRGWRREYPTEIATYADGASGDPSITSERFWQEAERSLVALIEHLRMSEWGQRVFAFHLERGEWFQPMAQGYDRSLANREAFRDWLREKYKHSLVALRAAWYDGDIQFHTAEIPPTPAKPNPQQAFFEPRRERRFIDFHEFTAESTARRLIQLAKTVKKATSNTALVSVCYGYTLEFGHPFSGHLALNLLLASPAINLICGPPSYRDRKPGGAASYSAPVDSLPLHGKLWLSEDDTKTYLSPPHQDPEDFNPRLSDRFLTEQAQARAFGKALAHETGISWMDLWGEGWLDGEEVWNRLGGFTQTYSAWMKHRNRAQSPEVVALIGEKSLLHVQRGEPFFRKLTNSLREALQRAGVHFGIYLQSDLLARDFPTDARLYLFLTPYRLPADQRAAIKEKLHRDGKTLVWIYAPGACEERPVATTGMEEGVTDAIGIAIRQQEWNSEIGSRIIEPYHPLTERLPGKEIGVRERLNPSFYVDDPGAIVLAEYQGSGLPSVAVRNFGNWQSVFVGDPVLPLELLRGICRYAGVHVWTPQGDDVVEIGNGWVMVHAARDGQRTLQLPEVTGLYDLTERHWVAGATREHHFFLRAGATRLFAVGAAEELVRRGLPDLLPHDRERARAAAEPPAEREAPREIPVAEAASPSLREDLETLEAILKLDVSQLEALEANGSETFEPGAGETIGVEEAGPPPEAPSEAAGNGRRRRRRGGRGHGRRRQGNASELAEGAGLETSAPSLPEGTPFTQDHEERSGGLEE